MSDIAIQANGLSKQFRRHTVTSLKERLLRRGTARPDSIWALRDATFEVRRGEAFGLIGPNGAGKSTALKVLAGIFEPTSGSVMVSGRVSALLELGAGFHPDLTGLENIQMNGSILGLTRREIETNTPRIIDFSGLGDAVAEPVKTYSSGMYARLGFSIAVHLDPEILIVDEILSVGDEEFQRRCFDHMYELRQRGTTIVMVSHAMNQIEWMCDRAAWLEHGHVRALGPTSEVIAAYLGDVNRAEAAAGGRITATGPAVGGGEVELEAIEFLVGDGSTSGELITGLPGTIRMHIVAHQSVPEALVGLGVFTRVGELVSAPSSRRGSLPLALPKGASTIDFTIPEVLWNPGTYELSTFLGVKGHWFDMRDKAFALRVRGQGSEDEGMTFTPGEWVVTAQPSGAQEAAVRPVPVDEVDEAVAQTDRGRPPHIGDT